MEEWQKPETITLWIVIGVILLLVLLVFVFIVVRITFRNIVAAKDAESKAKLEHQQRLLETTLKTQEKERKRIAADLHDALIGKLTVAKLQQESKKENLEIIDLLDESISTARRISHDLSPPLLEFTSLDELIKELITPWEQHIKFESTFHIDATVDYSNETKLQFIRIIQELITNSIKHAKASTIQLHYRQSKGNTLLRIQDDGIGFDMEDSKKGLGLKNIESRVQHLKGNYRVRSEKGKGMSTLFLFNNEYL